MYDFMIFKDETNTSNETQHYEQMMEKITQNILSNFNKGKKVLLITGSGISSSIPSMQGLMDKIVNLVNDYDVSWNKSDVFQEIFCDYLKSNNSEKHQMQSRLLTYIQNAYMGKRKYVQAEDIEPLTNIWGNFVEWLLYGDAPECKRDNGETIPEHKMTKNSVGVVKAEPSLNHKVICEMYEHMNAISITTNFDNLLQKAFKAKNKNFYPILDIEAFDRYYLSNKIDNSFIEIQSRGDVFWIECTGARSKICPNMHRQCFVPQENVEIIDGKVVCTLCKSEAKIYFAFPGTKEKDAEMSVVINGVWKYLANTISYVIVIGNSMDYDPILVEFLRELIRKRKIPVLYISRLKKDERGKGIKEVSEIYQKEATKFLFFDYENTQNIWARAEKTNEILEDLLSGFLRQKKSYVQKEYQTREKRDIINYFNLRVEKLFSKEHDYSELETELRQNSNIPQVFDIEEVKQMRQYSQLGLKTYWLHGNESPYQEHNRLKHSVGVMLIASYLYFKINPKPDKNELKFLQLAALLHDLGHLPFSHLLEEVFDEFGWIPAGESTSFNHEQHTKRLIEKLVEGNEVLKQTMEQIGYTVTELQQLINGEYGKGYLDALINSPLDCDKIEYLFSDSIFMHRGTKEDFDIFIKEYAENLLVNENDFLVLQGNSTKSFLKLIRMRGEMYDQVYLRSGLRYLEACCKMIIRTFMAYACAEQDVFIAIEDKKRFVDYFNLSDSKIEKIINFMVKCLEDIPENQVCEIHVLKKMVNDIEKNPTISNLMKTTIVNCMKLIEKTRGNDEVTSIENERILTYEVSNNNFDKSALKQLLKNVYLRFPGVILIDFVESKSSFSFGKRETRRRRNDGTKSATENILIKDIIQVKGKVCAEFKCLGDVAEDVNKELHYSNHRYINIYRISDNLFQYMQAEDYILNELRKEGVIDEK